MFKTLKEALNQLPELLKNQDQWHSLDIDYHPPRVKRVWTSWEGNRIMLHRISPCGPNEALYHPHPWPSAMAVMRGQYETGIGYGPGLSPPPLACRMIVNAGDYYEMTEADAWHYVRPLQETFTIMVSGKPWNRETPRVLKKLPPLDKEDKEDILFTFNYHLERWPIRIPNF